MNVFVYGTLKYPGTRETVMGSDRHVIVPGTLRGYTMHNVDGAFFPAIILDSNARWGNPSLVHGFVLMDVDEHEMVALRRYEGDLYTEDRVDVEINNGDDVVDAMVFVASDRLRPRLDMTTAITEF